MAGFDVTGLSDFTKKATELFMEAVLFNDNMARFEVQDDIQYKKYLNYIDADPTIQAGGCSLTDGNGVTLTEKEIEVAVFGVKDSFCLNDLRKKNWAAESGTSKGNMQSWMRTALVKAETDKIKTKMDAMTWIGATAGGDLIDGWITEAVADADVIDVTSVAPTVDTIDERIQEMINAVPAAVYTRGKLTIHASTAYYNLYRQNRINANLYHLDPKNTGLMKMDVFGYEGIVEIVAEPGMGSDTHMLLTWDKNLVIGVDEVSEVSSAELYFDPLSKKIYFMSNWKYGNTYKFGSEIILYTPS